MEMESKSRIRTAAILFIAALAVRVLFLIQFRLSPFFDPQVVGLDASVFDGAAIRLASGDWLGASAFEMMPGFAYVLGVLYAIIGRHLLAAYILQTILGALVVPFVYLIAERLAGRRAALIAGIGAVISQSLIFHIGIITGDTLAVLLAALLIYVLVCAVEGERTWPFILAGAIAGAGILCRGTFAVFIFLFLPWYVVAYRRFGFGRNIVRGILIVVAALVVVAPVTIRNYVVSDDFVPVTAHGGLNVYLGYNPHARGGFRPVPGLGVKQQEMIANAKRIAEETTGRALKPSEVSRFWRDRALQFIRRNPGRTLELLGEKVLMFFNHARELSDMASMKLMGYFLWFPARLLLSFGAIAVLGLAGMILWPTERGVGKGKGLLYLFVLANLLAVIATLVNDRYRLTSVPFLLIFGGFAIDHVIRSLRRPGRLAVSVIVIVICGAIAYAPLIDAEPPAVRAKKLGDAFVLAGRTNEAEEAYKKSIALDAAYLPGYFYLGGLYWKQERFDDVQLMMKEMLRVRPNHIPALNSMGEVLLRKGDRAGAVRYWKKSLAVYPDQPEIRTAIERVSKKLRDSTRK